ncbi:glycosyltransferase family 2 protein [Olivibacter sitiensis]|uniref:glycosyltransferase family 2 protein n=1 Tax=Olivibacter sitiensis TaxID=376470 RepID=UPI00040B5938|nr:glycosyltransferase family 2 protein [Olivibacter sitiensis]
MNRKIAIVILNWNGKHYLERFLPSVCANTPAHAEIVVGDNGSTDDSVDFMTLHYPQIRLVQTGANLGFAGGYNAVLKEVIADYYVLLNSDVEVSPDWISPIIALMESSPAIAAAQPKIRSYDDRQKFEHAGAAGGYIDLFGFPFCRGRILNVTEEDNGQYDEPSDVFWASGAALFIRSNAWAEMGGFDSDFFAHMEEIDLCWRLKNAGHRVAYCPQSVVFHVGGGTLSKTNPYKTYLNFRNNLYMLQKNLPFLSACCFLFIRLWLDLAALIHFLLEGNRKEALAISKAHFSFFRFFWKTARKRKHLSKGRGGKGIYCGSVMWDFFVRGKKKFSDLDPSSFS